MKVLSVVIANESRVAWDECGNLLPRLRPGMTRVQRIEIAAPRNLKAIYGRVVRNEVDEGVSISQDRVVPV